MFVMVKDVVALILGCGSAVAMVFAECTCSTLSYKGC